MKSCKRNRKPIAWLVLNALDAPEESALRLHLETCGGCQQYRTEISALMRRVAAAKNCPDLEATEAFHQRVAHAIRAQEAGSAWDNLAARVRSEWGWRVALPAISAALMLVAALSLFGPRRGGPLVPPTTNEAVLTTQEKSDLEPTLANYQMIANRSLDRLDEMLALHPSQYPSPVPIYTAMPAGRAQEWE